MAVRTSSDKPNTGIVVKEASHMLVILLVLYCILMGLWKGESKSCGVKPEHGLLGALSLSLNPKATEAFVLWYGIKYGKKLGITNVDIRGDALNVLNGLKTRD
ncbi:hypothetical protein ACLB2K_002626 [Fragaria x ananassa]